jgi:hypothetical protein
VRERERAARCLFLEFCPYRSFVLACVISGLFFVPVTARPTTRTDSQLEKRETRKIRRCGTGKHASKLQVPTTPIHTTLILTILALYYRLASDKVV